jgi:GNAT superfamily N-acetyltransferase
MREIKYVKLEELNLEDLKTLLNKHRIRKHLIEHKLFDSNTIKSWIQEKCEVDCTDGCRVRGIISNNSIVGWCGIQFEDGKYEIAIVLDDEFWGIGKKVFNDTLNWAKELGHNEVFIHFLHTRPEYKLLRKISKNVFVTEMFGNKFTTYQISVC